MDIFNYLKNKKTRSDDKTSSGVITSFRNIPVDCWNGDPIKNKKEVEKKLDTLVSSSKVGSIILDNIDICENATIFHVISYRFEPNGKPYLALRRYVGFDDEKPNEQVDENQQNCVKNIKYIASIDDYFGAARSGDDNKLFMGCELHEPVDVTNHDDIQNFSLNLTKENVVFNTNKVVYLAKENEDVSVDGHTYTVRKTEVTEQTFTNDDKNASLVKENTEFNSNN